MARFRFIALSSLPALCMAPQSALPAASVWEGVQGGAVRIVLSSRPDEVGRVRGALQIVLDPGWKTYWLDPGDAGVPPSVTVAQGSKAAEMEIGFPPPGRHDDGFSVWAGYDGPVSLALSIRPDAPRGDGPLDFSVFIGVCETICIPVQASFSVEQDDLVASAEDEAVVDEAFAALPGQPHAGLRVVAARIEGDAVIVETEAPAAGQAELFLASTENRMFGTPDAIGRNGHLAFRVPLLANGTDAVEEARYTLISGADAVTGTIAVTAR